MEDDVIDEPFSKVLEVEEPEEPFSEVSEVLERTARVEQKVIDQNGSIERLEKRVTTLDKRHWSIIVMIVILLSLSVGKIIF